MKKILRTCTVLLVCFTIFGGIGIQAHAQTLPAESNTTSIITPQSDIIEWRYKVEDGKLYKRQYNYTKDKWVGAWILVS